MTIEPSLTLEYFVDEAGDGTLFDRKKRVIIGREGCSRYFLLGKIALPTLDILATELADLRQALLADPYFRGVPSMQPGGQKTAQLFHAKDDLPEVRRETFAILRRHPAFFSAVIRDKSVLVEEEQQRRQDNPTYRYQPNTLYDALVSHLFADHLHQHDAYTICFAKRGHADRTSALRRALDIARMAHNEKQGIVSEATIHIQACQPYSQIGLQVVDYYLWAIQRYYERGEDRYLAMLWPSVEVLYDIDAKTLAGRGVTYTQQQPLIGAAVVTGQGYRGSIPTSRDR